MLSRHRGKFQIFEVGVPFYFPISQRKTFSSMKINDFFYSHKIFLLFELPSISARVDPQCK